MNLRKSKQRKNNLLLTKFLEINFFKNNLDFFSISTYLTKITRLITASVLRWYNVHHQIGKCTLVVAQVLFQGEVGGGIIFVAQSESKQSKLLAIGLQCQDFSKLLKSACLAAAKRKMLILCYSIELFHRKINLLFKQVVDFLCVDIT